MLADGSLIPAVQKLVDGGSTVVGLDLLHQGESLVDGQPLTRTPRVKNPRESAAYTFGYNPAVFTHRVHDVLTAVQYIRGHEKPSSQVSLVALDATAPIAAAARAQSGKMRWIAWRFTSESSVSDESWICTPRIFSPVVPNTGT